MSYDQRQTFQPIVEQPVSGGLEKSAVNMDDPPASLVSIPEGAQCQERHPQSGHRYFPCAKPAVAIMKTEQARLRGDKRAYFMCRECSMTGIRHYGGFVLFTADDVLLKVMRPQHRAEMEKRIAAAAPKKDEKKG